MFEPGSRWGHPAVRVIATLAWMGLIFALSHRSTLPTPKGMVNVTSVTGHFTVYFVLAILLWTVLGLFPISSTARYVGAWVLAALYGVSDEWHQSFIPGRYPDVFDVITDGIGAACGLLLVWWLTRRLTERTSGAAPTAHPSPSRR
jgi:VanZ family protein